MLNYSVNKVELEKKPPGVKLRTLVSPELSLDHLNQHCRYNQQPTMAKWQSTSTQKPQILLHPEVLFLLFFSFLKTDLDQKKYRHHFRCNIFSASASASARSTNPNKKIKIFSANWSPEPKMTSTSLNCHRPSNCT